ncbi:syntaxin 6, N-terminal-domain-containing protein [Chytridium lagenaria]|nr:syntaxin 6, N-terminal-domain-containing protein [Chytridium lagenaria]
MEDPFYSVKDEVEVTLGTALQVFDRLRTLRTTPTGWGSDSNLITSDSEDTKWLTDELEETIISLEEDLQDLSETIRVVESNRFQIRLDAKEIAARKTFVATARRKPLKHPKPISSGASSSSTLNGSTTYPPSWTSPPKSQFQNDRDALFGGKSRLDVFGRMRDEEARQSNQRFIEHESGFQQQIIRDQDAQLEDVMGTVGNLKEVAIVMGRELDDQARLLDDLESGVDTTAGKLRMGLKRMKEFMDANADSKQQWTICILISVLVFLLFILLII